MIKELKMPACNYVNFALHILIYIIKGKEIQNCYYVLYLIAP